MNERLSLLVLALCLLASASGCIEDHPTTVGLSPLPEVQTDGFHHEGRVELHGVGTGCAEDVTVSLYHANRTRIKTVSVGTLCYGNESPDHRNVTLDARTQPAYIVLRPSDDWKGSSGISPVGYVRQPNSTYYQDYPIQSRGQIEPRGTYAEPVTAGTAGTAVPSILLGLSSLLAVGGSVIRSPRG